MQRNVDIDSNDASIQTCSCLPGRDGRDGLPGPPGLPGTPGAAGAPGEMAGMEALVLWGQLDHRDLLDQWEEESAMYDGAGPHVQVEHSWCTMEEWEHLTLPIEEEEETSFACQRRILST